MSVTFYLANDIQDARYAKEAVDFDENLDILLYENRNYILPLGNLLVELDPYGDKLFNQKEVESLSNLCRILRQKFLNDQNVVKFSNELEQLCKSAMNSGQNIIAIGD